MKKKILILSLAINIIAGAFVLYAFTPKMMMKEKNDGGGGYVILNEVEYPTGMAGKSGLFITDENGIKSQADLEAGMGGKAKAENNRIVVKNLNELKTQGYEMVCSNTTLNQSNTSITNYVFVKK